ncbi:hypothetical protein GCM10009117_12200 [Gangjinia marincola]|uniref:CN hydrolase domain-containing protein n=1 Tax=Gangjinia marincola TaxID=578463 RepID=A0ABN1MFY8_9FLAO
MQYPLKIAMAQIGPIWLDKTQTIEKAGNANAELMIFGEALLPGYPFWLSMTNGSKFNDQTKKIKVVMKTILF